MKDSIQTYFHDFPQICIDEKWGYLDENGTEIISPKYDKVTKAWQKNDYIAVELNKKWGFIDKTGKVVYPFTIDLVRRYLPNREDPRDFLINGKWIEARDMQMIIENLQKK